MDDAEIVATIAAGELDGLAAALDQYAVSLFEYCHSLTPEAAVDAVHDTFIVAWCKLDGLRDPGKLNAWLETVAANECFRHTLTAGEPHPDLTQTQPLGTADVPARMPPGLPGRVISECADETAAGRALRVWVTNRAGPFGRDGFPAAHLVRRRYLSGHRRLAVAAAALAVLALAGAASAALVSPGGRHDAATATEPDTSTGASGAATPGASLPTTPASPIPSTGSRQPHRTTPSKTSRGTTPRSAVKPGARTSQEQASPPVVMLATMPPSAVPPPPSPPPPPPARGVIAVNPPQLTLVLGGGSGVQPKMFQITAENGPVNGYSITVPPNLPGTLIVSPSSGSLAAGAMARISVAAISAVPFTADITIYPGDILVQVTVKVHKAKDG